jgi:hypothetical protein
VPDAAVPPDCRHSRHAEDVFSARCDRAQDGQAQEGWTPNEVMDATCYERITANDLTPVDACGESVVSFAR